MKTVGIKDLKNNLSAYLREVRRGTRILVSDRSRVIAELHEPGGIYTVAGSEDPLLAEWISGKIVIPPRREKQPLPKSPVSLKSGTALRTLDSDRGSE